MVVEADKSSGLAQHRRAAAPAQIRPHGLPSAPRCRRPLGAGLSSGEAGVWRCYCGTRRWCPPLRRLSGWLRAVANSAATSGSM